MTILETIISYFGIVYQFLDNNRFAGLSFIEWAIVFLVIDAIITIAWKGARS